MIKFTKAVEVKKGDKITSTQKRKLALAFNDRLLSGIGDSTPRILSWWQGLVRKPRAGDGTLTPSEGEFLQLSQLNPTDGEWPATGPGDPGGANLANPLQLYIHGSEAANLDSEDIRIAGPDGVPLWISDVEGPPTTHSKIWLLGKLQRGAIDPTTGNYNAPAFRAARSFYRINYSILSQYGNAYGGFAPIPPIVGDCGDGGGDYANSPKFEVKFQNVNTGAIETYTTCPNEPTDVWVDRNNPEYFRIFRFNGEVIYRKKSEWREGPYKEAKRLQRQPGEHIKRILQYFASKFRGTSTQREGKWLAHAANVERFLTSQYFLAPAYGQPANDLGLEGSYVEGIYPSFRFTGTVTAGTFAAGPLGSSGHAVHPGYCIGSALVYSRGAQIATQIQIVNGNSLIATVDVPAGDFEKIITFTFTESQSLRVKASKVASFDAGADKGLVVEFAELLTYKPEAHDLCLVWRLTACKSSLFNGTDGYGDDFELSKEITDSYFSNGCVVNLSGAPMPAGTLAESNTNAVWESARQFANQCVRMLGRNQLTGYEVANGKSILYFRRYDYVDGVQIDLFDGIADAITSVAPKEGWSNQWCLDVNLKHYSIRDTSIWKPDVHADYWMWYDRCHFMQQYGVNPLPTDEQRWHYQYGSKVWLAPETVSGYRNHLYSGANYPNRIDCGGDPDCEDRRKRFYHSCRIYEPPVNMEKAEAITEAGVAMVKVTLTGRLHHNSTAPATISRNRATWTDSDLHSFDVPRTHENGIREYLLFQDSGVHCTGGADLGNNQAGNSAWRSGVWISLDVPEGACFPTIYLTKLISYPYEDTNDNPDASDTKLWHDELLRMETYLFIMCQGAIDEFTSNSYGCEKDVADNFVNDAYDFTWANLHFAANGTTAATLLPRSLRPDMPSGPILPNTTAYAETFNQLVRAINLLDTYRVIIPFTFETRQWDDEDTKSVVGTDGVGNIINCSTAPSQGVIWSGTPIQPPNPVAGSWTPSGGPVASTESRMATDNSAPPLYVCDGNNWLQQTLRSDSEYRITLDDDRLDQIPDAWKDMIQTHTHILVLHDKDVDKMGIIITSDVNQSAECQGSLGRWPHNANYLNFDDFGNPTEQCRIIPANGRINAPAPEATTLAWSYHSGINSQPCQKTSSTREAYALVNTGLIFIKIPLE